MGQKRALDLPVIGADGIGQRGPLGDDGHHETGPSPCADGVGAKLRRLEEIEQFLYGLIRPGMAMVLEKGSRFLRRGLLQVF